MPKNNHHYVPQFYLRFFGIDFTYIQLFNIKNNQFVPKAPIKHQCAKRKFYGKEEKIEDILSEKESEHAIILRMILKEGRIPDKDGSVYKKVLEFVALQLLRTKSIADEMTSDLKGFANTITKEFPGENNPFVDNLKKDIQSPIFITLGLLNELIDSISDLKLKLLYMGSDHNLVTSDSPVVKYNLYNQAIQGIGLLGSQNRGIIFFIPLSPKYLLLLYDPNIYTISKDCGPENITTRDVDSINLLQFTFCDENIYFNDGIFIEKIKLYAKKAKNFRNIRQPKTEIFEEVGNKYSLLVAQHHITPNLRLALSFIKVKKSALKISYQNRINDRYREELPNFYEDLPGPKHPVVFRIKRDEKSDSN